MTTPALVTRSHRFPVGVSVRSNIRYIASVVLRNYHILETRLVVDMRQLRAYKVLITGAAPPLEMPEQVHDDVLTRISMLEV